MPNYNQGPVNAISGITPGKNVVDGVNMTTRRLYDFSDRVAELSPEESPFFVYLSQVAKVPTSDSQFRYLEDRTQIAMTDRSFQMAAGATIAAPGGLTSISVDDGASAPSSIDYLIKGMVLSIRHGASGESSADELAQATVRIESVTHGSSSSTLSVKTIESSDGSTLVADDNALLTVIGTGFGEGSGAPDVFSQKLDDGFGYTQIFKTACEMSNTALATIYRGYADEWARIWNLKLREHKIDIERAMLFGMKGSQGGVQYTDGITGSIVKNAAVEVGAGNPVTEGNAALSYTEKKSFIKSFTAAQMTYDALLGDFEVIFDPARGGASSKLALASLPVMSHFNKLGSDSFINGSVSGQSRYNFDKAEGAFGHKVLKIDTIHGDMTLVKEPLFRANYSGYMALIDLDHVAYRPLVGNGYNRDTSITTNVQQADEDLRKDLILTEAGLEVSLPETHALLHLEGV